jgi:predicted nucleic acid-binding Zn ribbon protein
MLMRKWPGLVEDPDDVGKRCLMCGKPFVAQRSTKRYCSATCRVNASRWSESEYEALLNRKCKFCNGPITYDQRSDAQFCSARCRQRWHRDPITWDERVALYDAMIEAMGSDTSE